MSVLDILKFVKPAIDIQMYQLLNFADGIRDCSISEKEERLNSLTTLPIEKDMSENINYDAIINDLHLKMFEETASYEFWNKQFLFIFVNLLLCIKAYYVK